MALRITDSTITSDAAGCTTTAHRADDGGWTVTSHPGRRLTYNQATTAMVLAETLAADPAPGDPVWAHIAAWRAELDPPGRGTACR